MVLLRLSRPLLIAQASKMEKIRYDVKNPVIYILLFSVNVHFVNCQGEVCFIEECVVTSGVSSPFLSTFTIQNMDHFSFGLKPRWPSVLLSVWESKSGVVIRPSIQS